MSTSVGPCRQVVRLIAKHWSGVLGMLVERCGRNKNTQAEPLTTPSLLLLPAVEGDVLHQTDGRTMWVGNEPTTIDNTTSTSPDTTQFSHSCPIFHQTMVSSIATVVVVLEGDGIP